MKSFRLWLENTDLTIPAGTTLFHGTIGKFPEKELSTGGYDKILWTTDNFMVAQSYIPRSGGLSIVSAESIARPSKDPQIKQLQKYIGIEMIMIK